MEITLPEVPAGILTLLAIASPYAVALINGLAGWTGWAKRGLSVAVSLVLSGVVIGFYYWHTGDVMPEWSALILLALVVQQASYGLVTKNSAKTVENAVAVASVTRKASKDPGAYEHSIIPTENPDGPSLEEVGGWLDEDPDWEDGDDPEDDSPRHAES